MFRFTRSLLRTAKLAGPALPRATALLLRRPRTRAARAQWLAPLRHHAAPAVSESRSANAEPTPPPASSSPTTWAIWTSWPSPRALAASFVSKSEIASWPLLGWMTTMSGTVYVQRGRGGSARARQGRPRLRLRRNVPIVFFPEGTSSDGSSILPFRTGLLYDCIAAGQPITAACIRYRLTRDNGPGAASHLPYWDDTPLAKHIFRLLSLRGIEIEIAFADAPIAFSPAALADRNIAGTEARNAVLSLSQLAS